MITIFAIIILLIIYDFGDIVMMKKCMNGIKKRAEKNYNGNKLDTKKNNLEFFKKI
jgi:hypothetical protein